MTEERKPIVVDIGAAYAMLQESPELCAAMNEMVGGPALVAAQAEIEDLRRALAFVKAERDHWHDLVPQADRVQYPFDYESH